MRYTRGAVAIGAATSLLLAACTSDSGDESVDTSSPVTPEDVLSELVTEEVEPGVFRVVHDGMRDLTAYLTVEMPTESPGILNPSCHPPVAFM